VAIASAKRYCLRHHRYSILRERRLIKFKFRERVLLKHSLCCGCNLIWNLATEKLSSKHEIEAGLSEETIRPQTFFLPQTGRKTRRWCYKPAPVFTAGAGRCQNSRCGKRRSA
jgi:hypothetical protein